MRILFLHRNFPAQFRHLATLLAKDAKNQVVFGTACRHGQLPGVRKVVYQPSRQAHPKTHHYVRSLEEAVLEGQSVYRVAKTLKQEGFYPDVVYAHSGWGPGLFAKDIFPKARYLGYFEWFYQAHGSDVGFDPSDPIDADGMARIRVKNAPLLLDLHSCDRGLCPTQWQFQQFPEEYHAKLTVLHDGVDTAVCHPKPGARLVLPHLDLSQVDEIVTYVGRGMEPYRGFPQFMQAVALLQQRRPSCHVVVVGQDRVAYGKRLPEGQSYKQQALATLGLDESRLHFVGSLPYSQYVQVLQASSVHVYLTYPFVLSWSMLEAMAAGCVVLGSRTAPVEEVIEEGVNGLLVDFFDVEAIATRIEEVLAAGEGLRSLRGRARETILQRFDLAQLLPRHVKWMAE